MNIRLLTAFAVAFLVGAMTRSAHANLIVSMTPSNSLLLEGTGGFIDVFVSSDSSDALDNFAANFIISGGAGLEFAAAQAEGHLTDPNYVFFGRSGSVVTGLPSSSVTSSSEMVVADLSDDLSGPPPVSGQPNPITLTGSNRLLARINVNALSIGTYSISMLNDPMNPSFSTATFDAIPFTATGTSITVTAVPEPSSFAFAGLASCSGLWLIRKKFLWKNRKKSKSC